MRWICEVLTLQAIGCLGLVFSYPYFAFREGVIALIPYVILHALELVFYLSKVRSQISAHLVERQLPQPGNVPVVEAGDERVLEACWKLAL